MAIRPEDLRKQTRSIVNAIRCLSSDSSTVDLQPVIDAITSLEVTVQSQVRRDYEKVKFCEDGILTGWVIKTLNEQTGTYTTTYWDANLNDTTVPPAGSACVDQDLEYAEEVVELCAIQDGDGYSAGDKIRFQYIVEITNPQNPVITTAKNLSDGTYPDVIWFQLNGTDLVGVRPPSEDFGDCTGCDIATPLGLLTNWG